MEEAEEEGGNSWREGGAELFPKQNEIALLQELVSTFCYRSNTIEAIELLVIEAIQAIQRTFLQ